MTDMISTVDAARLLGVRPERIRQYIADGRLTATRVGNSLVLLRSQVERFERRPTGRPPGRRTTQPTT